MDIEYEEFTSIEEIFAFMTASATPMKNVLPINSYKGHIMALIPLNHATSETYLMVYATGSLDPGIYEFDLASRKHRLVESIERADKSYFIVMTPKRNTIADKALENLEQNS